MMPRIRSTFWSVVALLAGFAAILALIGGMTVLLLILNVPFVLPLLALVVLFAMSGVYAWVTYRQGRQDEFRQVLAAATQSGLPLGTALRAYLHDRPDSFSLQLTLASIVTPIIPGFILAWWVLRIFRFDKKVVQLADLLDSGWALPDALREVRGLAPRETIVAAEIGLAAGHISPSLMRADRERLTSGWLELIPRVLYPLVVLVMTFNVTSFLMIMIMPRFKRIIDEFGTTMPALTLRMIDIWSYIQVFLPIIVLGFLASIVFAAVLIASPTARWHFPIFGRWYRWDIQGEVSRLLGIMLESGMTVPNALRLLTEHRDYPPVIHNRLLIAQHDVEQGITLSTALHDRGLLASAMLPVLAASERAGTVPWTLKEVGEYYGGRALRAARRLSYVVSPLCLIIVATLVGYICVATFIPLIHLLGVVSE